MVGATMALEQLKFKELGEEEPAWKEESLDSVKALTAKLKLQTRTPSYLEWEARGRGQPWRTQTPGGTRGAQKSMGHPKDQHDGGICGFATMEAVLEWLRMELVSCCWGDWGGKGLTPRQGWGHGAQREHLQPDLMQQQWDELQHGALLAWPVLLVYVGFCRAHMALPVSPAQLQGSWLCPGLHLSPPSCLLCWCSGLYWCGGTAVVVSIGWQQPCVYKHELTMSCDCSTDPVLTPGFHANPRATSACGPQWACALAKPQPCCLGR